MVGSILHGVNYIKETNMKVTVEKENRLIRDLGLYRMCDVVSERSSKTFTFSIFGYRFYVIL